MAKFFAVELTTVAIVQVADDQGADDAEALARDQERDILRDVLDMDISVAGEITAQQQLSLHGWDADCLPYGGDGNTRLRDLLPTAGVPGQDGGPT